jgi:hypothetical protein
MVRAWFAVFIAMHAIPATYCAEPSPAPNHVVSRIPRQPVQSTAIAKIGYSKRRHILEIEFVNGAVYRYLDVPPAIYRGLMSAGSKALFYKRRHHDIGKGQENSCLHTNRLLILKKNP